MTAPVWNPANLTRDKVEAIERLRAAGQDYDHVVWDVAIRAAGQKMYGSYPEGSPWDVIFASKPVSEWLFGKPKPPAIPKHRRKRKHR